MAKRILVIEDDDIMQQVINDLMEREGYEPTVASNGIEGVKSHRENPFDLVITDLVMPEMEGLETISHLKSITPDLKIIAISGGGQIVTGQYLHIADKIGAAYTFPKPLDFKAICAAVKELLNN
ncbi:MAG: response regulator [bacterium]|nr:response regulator [bacterium]